MAERSAASRRAAAPQRPVLVLERRREADRVLDRRRLDHEPAVLVVLVRHRVRRDRVDHVRVLRLVEQAEDEPHRMEAEVAADEPAARAVRQARAQEELRRVQRPGGDDDGARVDARRAFRRGRRTRLPSPRRPRSRRARHARRRAARAGRPPRRRGCTCSASTCPRSSGSPAGTSRSSCSSRRCRT